ncbi:MAG: type II secretion system F family protein, partial [Acidimicrobiales bacterium]
MTPVLLGLAWAWLVLAVGSRCRPLPLRLPERPSRRENRACRIVTASTPESEWRPIEVLGRGLLRLDPRRCGRSPAPDRALARRVGLVALAAACTAAVVPVLAPVALVAGWIWPRLQARRQERGRLAGLEAGLPEVVDLLVLAVGAGANVSHAVAAAGRRGTGPLAAELVRITEEVRRGARVADALDGLPERAGEAVRPLAAALAACERYGALLGPTLERLGDDVRRQRQRRAEEA